jgi:hypothetical protein
LTFTDTTGAYAASNVTGWGNPNEAVADATAATLSVTPPGGAATVIDLYSDFPTSDGTSTFEITGDLVTGVGENTNFPDGLYEFVYSVTTGTTTYTTTKQLYFYCGAKCCVDKLFANIDFTGCDCVSDQIDEALLALALLRGISYHVSCGNTTEADNIKAKLSKLCANSKYCNNCG